jgi:hypothetical protein
MEKYILRFKIAMHDVVSVEYSEGLKDLCEVGECLFFR